MRFDDVEMLGLFSWQDTMADTLKKRLSAVNPAWGSFGNAANVGNMHRAYVAGIGAGVALPRTLAEIGPMGAYIAASVNVPERVAQQFVTLLVGGGTSGTIPYSAYDPIGYKSQETAKKAVTGEKTFLESITPKFGPGLAMVPLFAIGGILALAYLLKQAAPVAREVRGIVR